MTGPLVTDVRAAAQAAAKRADAVRAAAIAAAEAIRAERQTNAVQSQDSTPQRTSGA